MQYESFSKASKDSELSAEAIDSLQLEAGLSNVFWSCYADSRLKQFELANTDPPEACALDDDPLDSASIESISQFVYVTVG